jgi:predicted ATPase
MQLENFKAFGERTVIPLAPITLIYGQNSSGKSSILQSLYLLKQTRESRDVEALLLPRTENGFADLGSFQEMLFDHDLKRTLSIRLDVALNENPRAFRTTLEFIPTSKTLGLELAFSRKKAEDEITLEGFTLCGDDTDGHIAAFEKCAMPWERRRYAGPTFRSERRRGIGLLRAARCTYISSNPTYWEPAYEWSVREKPRLIDELTELRRNLHEERDTPAMTGLHDDDEQSGEGRARLLAALEDYITFMSSEFSFDDYVQRMIRQQLNCIVALDGFIPFFSGPLLGDQCLQSSLNRALGWHRSRWHRFVDIGESAVHAGRMVEHALNKLFPLGPFRKPPSRWYIFTGTTPHDVGYQGHLLPDLLFRNSDLRKNTNEWLKALDIGYEITLHHLGERSSDLFELRLLDTRRKPPVEVGLSDVGFGISQILPFVVQSLAASDQIISIEQPEVHIHPRLQADLGDLLIEAIKEPRQNQFLIETHSEHLALRLQRRVREKKLSPDQISIVYVSRGPNGATVQPLRLDEEGDFIDDFPGGFFPERLRELR